MEIKSVMNKYGELEPFQPKRITYKIMEETGLDKDEANKIQHNVIHALKNRYTESDISTSTIRSLINQQLISKGYVEEEKKSRKLGMSVSDFENLLENGNKDNANIFYSSEMIAKYAFDSVAKEYALLSMPKECAEAHKNGFIHCLGGNNNLIVKENGIITIKNIVEIVDSFNEIDYYVPSINPTTLEIEWKKIIDGACTGKKPIYEIEFSKGYKIECTSDHKFLKYDSRNQKFSKNYNICIDDFDKYKSKNSIRFGSLNYIPHQNNDENYLKSAFYGFFLGDGTLTQNSKVQFHFVKSDKIKYITELLDLMGIDYISKEYNKDKTIYVICDNIFEFRDKNSLPCFELNYTGLLEGLINSDGYVTTHGGLNCNYLEFDSTNKFISDLFFIACLTHNIRPSYQCIEKKNNWSNIYRCIIQNNFVLDLLQNINLRENHKNKLTNNKSEYVVHKTTGISPKRINYLRDDLVYNITVEDNHNFMAGTQGFVLTQNCHDLEYWNTRHNCANWSIPFIAKNGMKIDGNGEYGSTTAPAKSLEVLLNHMLEFMMAGALCLSGGQSYSSFNVYLAPYCKNRSYKEIKQAIQNFWFNCNCALIARGGQTIFSSVNIEFGIPDFLKNEPAISIGGKVDGVYGDYEKEAKLIFKAIIEVTKEKDANGRYHTFPNQIYMVRDNTFDEYNEEVQMVHELLAENPTIYFSNVSEEYTENAVTMGCRTRMPQTYTGDYAKDCLNVGNFHYITLNLPLIALESDDYDDFKTKLSHYMDISRLALMDRKANVEDVLYNKHMSDFLIQKDKDTGEQLFDIERCSFSIGLCGLNECLLTLFDVDIIEGIDYGEEIVKFMTNILNQYKEEDGLRWSLFFSPAESTAHRFAEINVQKYPNDAIVQGKKDYYYLTNSSHIDVSNEANLIEHIKNADVFHKYAVAGNICHLWLGEAFPNPKSLYSLNKKIAKTNIKFWAFTNDYSYCRDCHNTIQLNKLDDVCPFCGSDDLLVMSRITGYYQPVKSKNGGGFNDGKLQEFKDRYRHKIN